MKAEELRIGNYVSCMYYDDNDDEIWEDTTILCIDGTGGDIAEYKFWFEGSSNKEIYHENKPIPLTEQWLLNFGFETINIGKIIYRKNGIEIYVKNDKFIFQYGISLSQTSIIEFVHHLQNLYFELTGEELIKLDFK